MNISTEVNLEDSQQNAFVQEWLEATMNEIQGDNKDVSADRVIEYDHFQYVLDSIQETYNYKDHEERKNAIASGGDIMATLTVLSKLMQLTPEGHELYNALELSYAFVNACRAIASGEVDGE